MRRIKVNGVSYPVIEKPGILKADLMGAKGWTSVWVEDTVINGDGPFIRLVDRVHIALEGM